MASAHHYLYDGHDFAAGSSESDLFFSAGLKSESKIMLMEHPSARDSGISAVRRTKILASAGWCMRFFEDHAKLP